MADRITPPFKATVIIRYEAAYPDPFTVSQGDRLVILVPPEEWPDWRWCEAQNGEKRWVPLEFLKIEGDFGIMNRAYDSTELSAESGDLLVVLEIVAGWAWCRANNNQKGWLPLENLRLDQGNR